MQEACSLVLVALALALLVAGCGGGRALRLGRHASTTRRSRRTEFNHWLSVAAKQQALPGATAAVPDPPNYTKCVAALQKAPVAKGQAKPTAAALKSQCAQEYDSLKQQVMQFLVQSEWLLKEADKRKINVKPRRPSRSSFERPEEAVVPQDRPTSRSSSRPRA